MMDIDNSELDNPNYSQECSSSEDPHVSDFNVSEKWTYTCRRYMQEVIPDVFLGPYSAASRSNLQYLLDHKITHIICVRHITEANIIRPNFPNRFKYLVLDIADTVTENIIQHFRTVKTFIDEGLQSSGRILVHGNTGISRSATLILAYVMETYDLSYKCAFMLVQKRRYCISPNKGFVVQLMEYVPIYKAYKMQKDSQYRSENQHNKRTIHQVEEDNHKMDQTQTT